MNKRPCSLSAFLVLASLLYTCSAKSYADPIPSTGTISGWFGLHVNKYTSWPVQVPFDTFRNLSDTGLNTNLQWSSIQTGCNPATYDFSLVDYVQGQAAQEGFNVHYTVHGVPSCVTTSPSCPNGCCFKPDGTPMTCPLNGCGKPGSSLQPDHCFPPADLNGDGSGTDQSFKDYITVYATYVHQNHLVNPGKYADITYWDGGNEYYDHAQFAGSEKQLARMLQDEKCIIAGTGAGCKSTAINPDAKILTAAMCDGGTGDTSFSICKHSHWDSDYLAAVPNIPNGASPAQTADMMNFHCYTPATLYPPEAIIPEVAGNQAEVSANPDSAGKPLYCSEGGGGGEIPNLSWEDAANWFPRYLIALASTGVVKFILFGYDFYSGITSANADMMLLWDLNKVDNACTIPANPGYYCTTAQPWTQVHNWLEGATMTATCSASGTTWTCPLTRSGGYQGLAVWDTSQTCNNGVCTTIPYSVGPSYFQYRDLAGNTTPISGGTVPIGLKPILVEAGSGTVATDCTIFVSPVGGGDGTSAGSPETLDQANQGSNQAKPGSVVCLEGGTYNIAATFFFQTSGTGNAYITWKAYGDFSANLVWTGGSGSNDGKGRQMLVTLGNGGIIPNGPSYLKIVGLNLDGANYAQGGMQCHSAHHVQFLNNHVKNMIVGGIGTYQCDYITMDHNTVWHAGENPFGLYTIPGNDSGSGISLGHMILFDNYVGLHNVISNNMISGLVDPTTAQTDGNGIILDNSDMPTSAPTLIVNNVVFGNGGRGIVVNENQPGTGNHITATYVINNTTYKNSLDLNSEGVRGNFVDQATANTIYMNDLSYAWAGWNGKVPNYQQVSAPNNITYNKVLWFGGVEDNFTPPDPSQFINADPSFLNPPVYNDSGDGQYANSIDPELLGSDLTLQKGSPAIGAGIDPAQVPGIPSQILADMKNYIYTDINGTARSPGGPFDLGAFAVGRGILGGSLSLNLPPFLAINAQISATYTGSTQASYFSWNFTPVSQIPSGSGSGSLGVISAAPSASWTSPGPQTNLGGQTLGLGPYLVSVQVYDSNNNTSAPAQAYVTLVPADLSGVRVFPNPWRSDKHSGLSITFDQLSVNSTIKIFTVSGHWVKTLPESSTAVTWDLTNDTGEKVASGLYVYLVKDDQGQKKTGQLAVIK